MNVLFILMSSRVRCAVCIFTVERVRGSLPEKGLDWTLTLYLWHLSSLVLCGAVLCIVGYPAASMASINSYFLLSLARWPLEVIIVPGWMHAFGKSCWLVPEPHSNSAVVDLWLVVLSTRVDMHGLWSSYRKILLTSSLRPSELTKQSETKHTFSRF